MINYKPSPCFVVGKPTANCIRCHFFKNTDKFTFNSRICDVCFSPRLKEQKCSKCKATKDLQFFYKNHRYCKECDRDRKKRRPQD